MKTQIFAAFFLPSRIGADADQNPDNYRRIGEKYHQPGPPFVNVVRKVKDPRREIYQKGDEAQYKKPSDKILNAVRSWQISK